MESHGPIQVGIGLESLKVGVLQEMKRTHALSACPLCGEPLDPATCSFWEVMDRHRLPMSGQEEPSNLDWATCASCMIVWKLFLQNTSNDNPGNLNNWEGHQLYLSGYTNCFCRQQVLRGSWTLIHDTKDRHSHIREECVASERR